MFKINPLLSVSAAAIATLLGFGAAAQAETIKVDGSSTVFPITEAAASAFQKQNAGTKVTVGVSGTGGGFKKFCAGETVIANASRPILQKEIDQCKAKGVEYVELPVAYDALTVVVSPQNTWAGDLSMAELKKIWEPGSTVKNWQEVRPGFPNAPIKLFGPGADSGTFDYFTEAVNGKAKASRTDFTGSEDDNVLVQGVSRDKNALGYFGFAYYSANARRLKAVTINGVAPSREAVLNGKYTPLARPLFIYVNKQAAQRPEVKKFVEFYLSGAPGFVEKVKYVPLPQNAYRQLADRFQRGEAGTKFGGKEAIGLSINDLLKK